MLVPSLSANKKLFGRASLKTTSLGKSKSLGCVHFVEAGTRFHYLKKRQTKIGEAKTNFI